MFAARIPASSQLKVQHRRSCRGASIVPRATNSGKFGLSGSPEPSMGLLQDRIKQLRGKQQAEQSKRMRPALPQNVLMVDEVESDHRLICNWHENAWSQLRDNMRTN